MQGEPWWTSWTMWCQITVKEVSQLLLLINYYYQNYFKIMPTSVYFIQTPITGCSIGGCWWKFNWSCNYGVCRQNPVILSHGAICILQMNSISFCRLLQALLDVKSKKKCSQYCILSCIELLIWHWKASGIIGKYFWKSFIWMVTSQGLIHRLEILGFQTWLPN